MGALNQELGPKMGQCEGGRAGDQGSAHWLSRRLRLGAQTAAQCHEKRPGLGVRQRAFGSKLGSRGASSPRFPRLRGVESASALGLSAGRRGPWTQGSRRGAGTQDARPPAPRTGLHGPPWFLSQVRGVKGVFLANQKVDGKVVTLITYNKGRDWGHLRPPSEDMNGKPTNCKPVSVSAHVPHLWRGAKHSKVTDSDVHDRNPEVSARWGGSREAPRCAGDLAGGQSGRGIR